MESCVHSRHVLLTYYYYILVFIMLPVELSKTEIEKGNSASGSPTRFSPQRRRCIFTSSFRLPHSLKVSNAGEVSATI